MMRRFLLAAASVAWLIPASVEGQAWSHLDLDGNGRFDRADVRIALERGFAEPAVDANADGEKNADDAWSLVERLTTLDRNGDGVVDPRDGRTGTFRLPPSDPTGARALALRIAAEYAHAAPGTLDSLLASGLADLLPGVASLDADSRVPALFLGKLGAAGLTRGNLEAAIWSFAQAAALAPGEAVTLNNLATVLLEVDRSGEAGLLLAGALALDGSSCDVAANLGVAASREGDLVEAARYHREAVSRCPRAAAYRLNLGSTLLRSGRPREATEQFLAAAALAPLDLEATLMTLALDPDGGTPDLPEMERLWEKGRAEERAASSLEGGEPWDRGPWADASAEERVSFILGEAEILAQREFEEVREAILARAAMEVEKAAQEALPRWSNACEDLTRWVERMPPTVNRIRSIHRQAGLEVARAEEESIRKGAANQLATHRVLRRIALAEARQRAAYGGREAFTEAMRWLYVEPLAEAHRRLRTAAVAPGLNPQDTDPEGLEAAVAVSHVGIMTVAMENPEYGASLEGCGEKETDGALQDMTYGASLFDLVGYEVTPATCEIKIQAGQGLLVAGSWSPRNGTSFQYGYGYDFGLGPLKVSDIHWTKIGSDGSITDSWDRGAGLQTDLPGFHSAAKGVQKSESTVIQAAQHEPVGASALLAEFLNCPPPEGGGR